MFSNSTPNEENASPATVNSSNNFLKPGSAGRRRKTVHDTISRSGGSMSQPNDEIESPATDNS